MKNIVIVKLAVASVILTIVSFACGMGFQAGSKEALVVPVVVIFFGIVTCFLAPHND